MLLRQHLPKKPPKNFSPSLPSPLLSFSSSSTHVPSYSQNAPANSPPRKGRQAVRRLLKLLSPLPGSQNAPNVNLSRALNALRTSPQTISSSDAAALVSAVGDPLLSFNFYRFLKSSKPLFRPDSSIFASLIQTQLHSHSPLPFRIEFYLEEMRKLGLTFSAAEFRSLFAPLFPMRYALAKTFLDQVVGALVPDSGVYGQAIEVFVDHGHIEEAINVSERAKEEIRNPKLSFYSSLIRVYGVTRNAKAAMEVFVEMEEGRVLPDERFYRRLLGILCQVGWKKLYWVVLEEMTRRTDFRTDDRLGLNLMRGFLKHGMVSEAELGVSAYVPNISSIS